ncbi:ATP-binding cassette domain-containing protein [Peptoniphilus catoniae]|uniref:ATP-binding cassette domain-containing protein n=1 Tax=Peptoniphilus catoniae TaxID=1660341 RepID=UPI0010FE966B|nr:ATP-binding cassette domain-containing protein [Peptoniphilus catoniae]
MSAIVINNLTKRVGKRKIFSNLNLEVIEGESLALLGLEESGKTTLAKILFNYLKPAKGKAYIYGMDCLRDSKTIKESVSLIPQQILYQDNLRASTIFKNTLDFHNLKNTEEVYRLSDYFNFNIRLKISEMTDNEKRIFTIINALIIRPRLVVIDEATKELTLNQKEKFFSYLDELKKNEGLTVLLLTDSLVEAQRYCDRAAYLYKGEIMEVEYLRDKLANDKIVKIYSPFDNYNAFIDIGARLIKNEPFEKVFYYDKDLLILSRVIANSNIANYSIEDSSLSDKINAYYENKDLAGQLNNRRETENINVEAINENSSKEEKESFENKEDTVYFERDFDDTNSKNRQTDDHLLDTIVTSNDANYVNDDSLKGETEEIENFVSTENIESADMTEEKINLSEVVEKDILDDSDSGSDDDTIVFENKPFKDDSTAASYEDNKNSDNEEDIES